MYHVDVMLVQVLTPALVLMQACMHFSKQRYAVHAMRTHVADIHPSGNSVTAISGGGDVWLSPACGLVAASF